MSPACVLCQHLIKFEINKTKYFLKYLADKENIYNSKIFIAKKQKKTGWYNECENHIVLLNEYILYVSK